MKRLNKKGVSLAELLAVVVIMGIIAAIAIPLVGNVIESTKKNAWIGDARTLQSAAITYCQVNSQEEFCEGTGNKVLTIDDDATSGFTKTPEAEEFLKFVSKDFNEKYYYVGIQRNGNTYTVKIDGNGFKVADYTNANDLESSDLATGTK